MNSIIDFYKAANNRINVKQMPVNEQTQASIQHQGRIKEQAVMLTAPTIPIAPPPVSPAYQTETGGDFDCEINGIIKQLKTILNSYELDEEDYGKISAAIMKLDSMLECCDEEDDAEIDVVVQTQSQPLKQTAPRSATPQSIKRQGSQGDVSHYLASMM